MVCICVFRVYDASLNQAVQKRKKLVSFCKVLGVPKLEMTNRSCPSHVTSDFFLYEEEDGSFFKIDNGEFTCKWRHGRRLRRHKHRSWRYVYIRICTSIFRSSLYSLPDLETSLSKSSRTVSTARAFTTITRKLTPHRWRSVGWFCVHFYVWFGSFGSLEATFGKFPLIVGNFPRVRCFLL